jgi:hypothetical protein
LRWTRGLSFSLVFAIMAATCFTTENWVSMLIGAAVLMIVGGLAGIVQEVQKRRDL